MHAEAEAHLRCSSQGFLFCVLELRATNDVCCKVIYMPLCYVALSVGEALGFFLGSLLPCSPRFCDYQFKGGIIAVFYVSAPFLQR
jgi:hypothetical protein